ncbi:LITAF-like zinc ribbon domain [Popillia japonica]|uniref:LITAF-like zinc ribbon domain n=1 Tax=Popillia japonica TaxID=7064 RepID=A0AAW1KI73_POPJA
MNKNWRRFSFLEMEKREDRRPYSQESHTYSSSPFVIVTECVVQPQLGSTSDTVIMTPIAQFGPKSQSVVCPHCRNKILTKVDAETSTKTHNASVIMCVLLLWPCAWMPYYMDRCKSRTHYCSNCGAYLGSYDN